MKELVFPKLQATDIEVRVGQGKDMKKGFSLLLYKDARVDQRILDLTFGAFGWQREHIIRENIIGGQRVMVNYCKVSIWDEEKKQWVSKEDCGTESNTEAIKGEASDAFKRACFNWGIGRELYTSPWIWVYPQEDEIDAYGHLARNVKFFCKKIGYDSQGKINYLDIVDQNGNSRHHTDKRTLEDAIALLRKQSTLNECSLIYGNFPQYQKHPEFEKACNEKLNELKNNGKSAKK